MAPFLRLLLENSVYSALAAVIVLAVRFVIRKCPRVFSYVLWAAVFFRLICPVPIDTGIGVIPELSAVENMLTVVDGTLLHTRVFRPSEDGAESIFPDGRDNYGTGFYAQSHAGQDASAYDNDADSADSSKADSSKADSSKADSSKADADEADDAKAAALSASGIVPTWEGWSDDNAAVRMLFALWTAGASALAALYTVSWLRLRRRVSAAVRVGGKGSIIYESDRIDTAFVRGLIRPRIYVPLSASQSSGNFTELTVCSQDSDSCDGYSSVSYGSDSLSRYRMILRHEQVHVRRGDNIIKPLALMVTCVYWFSPMAWLSYFLMCRDMEMSCDEAVLYDFGEHQKGGYCKMLLDFGTDKKFSSETAFGECSASRRIKHLLFMKRPTVPAVIAAAALVVLSMTACVGTMSAPDYIPTVSGTNVSAGDADAQDAADAQDNADKKDTAEKDAADKDETADKQNIADSQYETDLQGVEFPDLLATYSTDYNEANVARTSNLCIAADYIEGSVIMPGEVFSFNKVVGEWTPERGFCKAATFPVENPDGGFDGGYGGGVSQTSSTLFYCAVKANLEIVDRTPNRYLLPYMVDDEGAMMHGSDATVMNKDGYDKVDMAFRNTKDYPIIIRTAHDKGVLTFEIWGTWDGYTAEYRFAETEYIPYSVYFRKYAEGKRERPGTYGCTRRTYRVVFYQEEQGVGERTELERYLEFAHAYEPLDRIIYVEQPPEGFELDVPYGSGDVAYLFPPQG